MLDNNGPKDESNAESQAAVETLMPDLGLEIVFDESDTTGILHVTIPGLSLDQVTAIRENFSGFDYKGNGVFTRHVLANTAEEKQALMKQYSADIRAFMETGYFTVLAHPAEPSSAPEIIPRMRRFLGSRRQAIPPRPGSDELKRQSVIIDAVRKHDNTDVHQAITLLTKHVETLDLNSAEAERDPTVAALGALRRVKADIRKKKIRSRLKWLFSLLLLVGVGVAFYFYGSLLYTRGHYTTVATCKVPFGDSEITGNRYSTFTRKSLLGYRVGSDVPETETTEIKLPSENLTVLGFDSATSKFWRVNYGKGEANTPKLRYTDMYWFVGDKEKTALVKYNDFCR